MRWFLIVLAIIVVCLSGLLVFDPVCIQTGDLRVAALGQGVENRSVERSGIISLGGAVKHTQRKLPCLQERYWPWHMTEHGYGQGMTGFWCGGFLMWIIFIAIIAVLVYFILRISKHKETDELMSETPLHILKKRYARGEISKEEFDEMKKDIEA